MKAITATVAAISLTSTEGFAPNSARSFTASTSTQLNGLFDGMKEAFSAPALETSSLAPERETPIDRWMGWNVQSEPEAAVAQGEQ